MPPPLPSSWISFQKLKITCCSLLENQYTFMVGKIRKMQMSIKEGTKSILSPSRDKQC
jgi:hypothetical protein